MNTVEPWRLVYNVTLGVRIWLAKVRSYFEVRKTLDPLDERLRRVVHGEKMDKFNLAVHGISKLRDLSTRMISEALGHSIFNVDYDREDWEERINVWDLQTALKEREKHERLRTIGDDDFEALTKVADSLRRKYNDTTKAFLR